MTLSPAIQVLAETRQEFMNALREEVKVKDRITKARYAYRMAKYELKCEEEDMLQDAEKI